MTRRFTALSLLLMLVPLAATQACKKAEASGGGAGDRLVVHEWGTFTSFQGANGVSVEGMQHETEALPSFVHSRVDARKSPFSVYGDESRDVPVRHCTGKMETPVIYFHSKAAQRVKIHVRFAGLLTQWYPAASGATPAFTGSEQYDLGATAESTLDWDLDVIPRTSAPPAVPAVSATSDWQKAREVDAAYVRAAGSSAEADHYVFYRGLMRSRSVAQPQVVARAGDQVSMLNASPDAIPAVFVLDMKGATGRFVSTAAAAPGLRELSLAAVPERPKAAVVLDVEQAMTTALIGQGLYADEARAMVHTWSETWFSAEGTRLLYLVPRPVTDKTLPMAISPAPDELVRVMVGRIEYLTPAKEEEVSAAMLGASDPKTADASFARLAKLGRFLEPAVRSIAQRTQDARLRAASTTILQRLAAH